MLTKANSRLADIIADQESNIIHHDKYSPGAAAYEVLTGEVLKRIK